MFTHFYLVPFTGLGLHNGFRGNLWLKNRIKVFKEYVVESLLNQTNQNFILWICWRKEERDNEQVIELAEFLRQKGLKCVITFSGIPFYDDKYDELTAKKRLMETLNISLPTLRNVISTDYVLLTIQPSDDLYFDTNTEVLQTKFKELIEKDKNTNKAVGWKDGYIMDYAHKEISEYLTKTNPPFFTILFSKEEFLDPIKHFNHIGPYKSHEYIVDHMNYHTLEGRGFIVGTHGENISTTYNHVYRGRLLIGEERLNILKRAGILGADPIRMKLSRRVLLRRIVNRLPFRNMLKWLYHSLPIKLRIF